MRDITESDDHSIPLDELLTRLDTDSKRGLREEQVISVRERYGENIVSVPDRDNLLTHFTEKGRGTYFLLTFGIIFCFTASTFPSLHPPGTPPFYSVYIGLIMVLMIVVSTYISYWQEMKSERVLSFLKDLYPYYSVVIRDGEKIRIDRRELVVGDVVRFEAGDCIPADIRITKALNLEVDERPLMFKGMTSIKSTQCTIKHPILSQNMAFFGTSCIKGTGEGIVTATGNRTAYGQMMQHTTLFQKRNTQTHDVVKRMRSFGVLTALLSLVMLAVHWCFVWAMGVIFILCQMIASIPDILYSTTTTYFYEAAKAMALGHCLPKNYEAIERLAPVSVICCNKTGTITQNKNTVVSLWVNGIIIQVSPSEDRNEMQFDSAPHAETWKALSRAACLCSRTVSKCRRNRCVIKEHSAGDQLEIAIMEFIIYTSGNSANTEKIDSTRREHRKVFEIPFSTYRKYQVTIHESPGGKGFLLCMKGAVDVILDFCSTAIIAGESVSISHLKHFHFQQTFEKCMNRGEVIIGFCDLELPKETFRPGHAFQESDIPLSGLRFLGFLSVLDPPKECTQEALARCRSAGIKVIMMTGDHRITAKAIARQVRLISQNTETRNEMADRFGISPNEVPLQSTQSVVITGPELEAMDVEELREHLRCFTEIVFARMTPRQKYDVIEGLQRNGEVVAFTGYSTEDNLAMLKADVGVGLTKRGCDKSRRAADIVLLGDSITSLVTGIEKAQLIYKNLRSAIIYVLSSKVPELSPTFAACILKIPLTLGAIPILITKLLAETFLVFVLIQRNSHGILMKHDATGLSKCLDYKYTDWIFCIPLPMIYFIYEKLRKYFVFNSENTFTLGKKNHFG